MHNADSDSRHNPDNWQLGDRVLVSAPGKWADGKSGYIRRIPRVGDYIHVAIGGDRITYPVYASELKRP